MTKRQKSNNTWRIIVENRSKYKYMVMDIKQILKLLCVDKKEYSEIFEILKERVSIRHIKTVAYILKYGELSNIKTMFIGDNFNPYKIKYMLARIKTVVKNFDRKIENREKLTIFKKYELLQNSKDDDETIKFRESKW